MLGNLRFSQLLGISTLGSRLWRFQFSFLIMTLGGRCNQLAVAWWALDSTRSAAVFSTMIACAICAEVLAKPLLGWAGDRHNKMDVVMLCNMTSLASALALWLLSVAGWFHPVLVGLCMIIGSIAVGVRDPIQSSIIPLLADKGQIALAFRSKNMMSSIALLIGPGLAGILVSLWNISAALAFDVAAATIAIGLLRWLHDATPLPIATCIANSPSRIAMILSGFKIVYRVRVEFFLALLAMAVNFALYPFFSILLPLFVKTELGLPAWYIGVLDTSFGVGILLGSYRALGWISNHLPRDASIALGFALLGGNLFVTGIALPLWLLPLAFLTGGVGLMLINVHASTVRTLATPESYRNRMAATVAFFSSAASPLGSIAIGVLAKGFSLAWIMNSLGALIGVLSLTVFCIPYFAHIMRMQDSQLADVYAEIYPTAFDSR
jgi:MFS family permease